MNKTALRGHAQDLSEGAIKCIRQVLTKQNMGLIEAAQEHGQSERKKALEQVLAVLALMYDQADQATPLHKGMRMALSSASDRVRDLTKQNEQEAS